MAPKLTIGMATFRDWDGPYFTIQALRQCNDLREVELIVVDNKPDSPESDALIGLIDSIDGQGNAGARYIAMAEPVGTTQPRQRVFDEASGAAVMCIDSHILLGPGTINRLIQWYADNPECLDLLSGPLVMDNMHGMATHFGDAWGAEMWGQWRQAWQTPTGTIFDVVNNNGQSRFLAVRMNPVDVDLPTVPFHAHEQALIERGYRALGFHPDDDFEIPGQGLGLFTCRKDAWLGFNPHWRGFGGEELQIHEKYRQAGRKCRSLGFLKWLHRFGAVGGLKYPAPQYDKIRNYVIGHQELNLSLDRVHHHFCVEIHEGKQSPIMPPFEWDWLLADPIGHTIDTVPRPDITIPVASLPSKQTIDELYELVRTEPRDLNEHMPKLSELASKCDRVTEFTKRRESTIAFAQGRPKSLKSYNFFEADNPALQALRSMADFVWIEAKDSPEVESIEETDLLFLKTKHTGERLAEELKKYAASVKRYIVVGDTITHGEFGEDGGPGYWYALRPFVAENPEWFVAYHTKEQFGLTVLSRHGDDRPKEPITAWSPGYGPGTELGEILKGIGIHPKKGCGCRQLSEQMDFAGPAECRANKVAIIEQIKKNQANWGWADSVAAAAKFTKAKLKKTFDFPVDWTDPYTGFVDEAIRRAEVKEQDRNQKAA